jgi:hypothetical protein
VEYIKLDRVTVDQVLCVEGRREICLGFSRIDVSRDPDYLEETRTENGGIWRKTWRLSISDNSRSVKKKKDANL